MDGNQSATWPNWGIFSLPNPSPFCTSFTMQRDRLNRRDSSFKEFRIRVASPNPKAVFFIDSESVLNSWGSEETQTQVHHFT